MSWLRRGARVPRHVIRTRSRITKGAVTPGGDVREISENGLCPGEGFSEERDAWAPKRRRKRRPSVVARGNTPLFFLIFFHLLRVSENELSTLVISARRWTGKRDMSYTEPLWEINGNQTPVSPRTSPMRRGLQCLRLISDKKTMAREGIVIGSGVFSLARLIYN